MTDEQKPEVAPNVETKPRVERLPAYGTLYTNNVQFEHNAFDLKMIFGQFDGSNLIKQHFAVNMAWAEAKAVANLLLVNIAFYESLNGRIQMPVGMTPSPPKFEGTEENPKLKKVQEKISKIQALVFGED